MYSIASTSHGSNMILHISIILIGKHTIFEAKPCIWQGDMTALRIAYFKLQKLIVDR